MLELLSEKESLWTKLQKTNKPIYLYGMGDGAEKAMRALARYHLSVSGVFASDGFVRGHRFKGFPVEAISDVIARHGKDFVALLCFGVDYEPMLSYLYALEEKCEFYAPDLPVIVHDDQLFDLDFLLSHESELDRIYERLADAQSKKVFLATLNYKLSGKVSYLKAISSPLSEVYTALILPKSDSVYVDLGGYTGDTIEEYLSYAKGAKHIFALEPDPKNFAKLLARAERLGIAPILTAENKAAWSDASTLSFKGGKGGRNPALAKDGERTVLATSVDILLQNGPADVLKYDVEGAEAEAIEGARHTISTFSPSILLSAYHKNEDLFALPLQVLSINDRYKVYLRHHDYIPAWETNYYFVKS